MLRLTTHTALATAFGLMLAAPAAAQSGCPAAASDSDADLDGVVTLEEAEAAAEREFKRYDMDGDETISRDEFVDCYAGPAQAEQAQSGAANDGGKTTRDEETFAAADLDRDGTVDRAEFGLGAQRVFDEALGLPPDAQRDENVAVPDGGGTGEGDEVTESQAQEIEKQEAEAAQAEETAEAAQTGETAEAAPVDETAKAEDAGDTAAADAAEPGTAAPPIVRERFLQSPYAELPTGEEGRGLTAEQIAFNSAQLFAALDRNRDEALEASEWMRVAPLAERGPGELGRVFEGIDVDGDTLVTLPEYVAAVLASHAAATEAAGPGEQAAQNRTDTPAAEAPAGTEESETDAAAEATSDTASERGAPLFLYRIYRF